MFENDHIKNHGRPMDYKEHRNMVVNMCGSLDVARDASKNGQSKRTSYLHESEQPEYESNVHDLGTMDSDDDSNTQELVELLVNMVQSAVRDLTKNLVLLSIEPYWFRVINYWLPLLL